MEPPAPPTLPDRDTLYYDGDCGLCVRSARLLRTLDWLGRLGFRDMTGVADAELPVPRGAAMRGIPMHTRSGGALVGYPAMRRALLQTPLGAIPALLMCVPGVSHVGRVVYRRVADNRARRAVCEASDSAVRAGSGPAPRAGSQAGSGGQCTGLETGATWSADPSGRA